MKKKLQRFAELATMPNVFQSPEDLAGQWRTNYFKNSNPISLELGCGRGEYTVAMAQKYPQQNFIGADLKGSRLWHGARWALDQQKSNVAFLRIFIERIGAYFAPGEVAGIWIPFPDPYPVYSKRLKRLTSPRFLTIYRTILSPGGIVHLKTDNEALFRYSLESITQEGGYIHTHFDNLDEQPEWDERLQIRTKYEASYRNKGKIIKYLCFGFDPEKAEE